MLVVECKACGTVKRFPVGMEAKKRPEWKLWGERSDVIFGSEEEKRDGGEAQKGNIRKLNAEKTENLAYPKTEELVQQ